jgi:hypothetical protein
VPKSTKKEAPLQKLAKGAASSPKAALKSKSAKQIPKKLNIVLSSNPTLYGTEEQAHW